jgi:hypothetical protein
MGTSVVDKFVERLKKYLNQNKEIKKHRKVKKKT